MMICGLDAKKETDDKNSKLSEELTPLGEDAFKTEPKIGIVTELKAAFLGREDDLILEYLKKNNHPVGLAQMYIFFVYDITKYGMMSERMLKRRLASLIRYGLVKRIYANEYRTNFYIYVKQETDDVVK